MAYADENEMMAAQTLLLLLVYSCVFIAWFQICGAKRPYCPPSSCGIIGNISHPFRLKGDPPFCGYRKTELVCETNVTSFYLNSHKYYVKAINYSSSFYPTIRLVDASIDNHTCSFPAYSAYSLLYYPYSYADGLSPINLMSCPQPLNTSIPPHFTDITHCQSSTSRFSYIKIGGMKASEVAQTCRVDLIVMTSWEFKNLTNVSLQEIHRSLLYGFEIEFCMGCTIPWTAWEKFMIFFYGRLIRPFQIFLLILVLSGAAVNPVMSMIGVAVMLLFVLSFGYYLYIAIRYRDPSLMIYPLTGYISWDPFNFGPERSPKFSIEDPEDRQNNYFRG